MIQNSRSIVTHSKIDQIEELEIDLLLEALKRQYGLGLQEYSRISLSRRIWNFVRSENLNSVSGLQERILHDNTCLERFLRSVSVNVSAFFRDPGFFLVFRTKVVPRLRTYPFVRIWQAGCGTGEEVYSMAILMLEEGLYDRCRIYGTDFNETFLRTAKAGVYSLEVMRQYADNYAKVGGTRSFSDYYTSWHDSAVLRPSLRNNIIFSQHNLVTDSSFNEFNVILCRNVMIYFNHSLQERVHRLLYHSLVNFGVLGLGNSESMKFTPYEKQYEELDGKEKLYRRTA
jgi:chemotaxis protein methyltransferase CheR